MTNESDLKAPPTDEDQPTERERELAAARRMTVHSLMGPQPAPSLDERPSPPHPHELFEDPQPDPLEPRVGPLKPMAVCKATGRPHRYVGPFDHCGDCGAHASTE